MQPTQPQLQPLRAVTLLAVSGGSTALAWRLAAPAVRRVAEARSAHVAGASGRPGRPPVTFAEVLEALAGAAILACTGWLLLAALLVCAEARRGQAPARGRPWLHPHWMRRVVVAGGGAALGLSLLGAPAVAGPLRAEPVARPPGATAALPLTGLPVPDRTSAVPAPPRRYTVAPGDSLWRVAERLLRYDAPPADVAAASRALVRLNRKRIGADRDLIFPGTVLHLPRLPLSGKDRP